MGYSGDIDHQLLRLVKNNNEEFLRILFNLYYSKLCTYASTFVKMPDVAEEIVQETFIKFWENRDSIDVSHSFRSYIFRSVHNNCINYLKKSQILKRQSREMEEEILYHNQIVLRNFSSDVINNLISEELEARLADILNEMPPQARKIFTMSRFDQLSYQEIADKLEISVNTVKTQMKRSLARLRELYNI